MYRWKPNKAAAKEFAAKMDEINEYCKAHGIEQSARGDSYYFTIGGQRYRVSNHTIEASNRAAYRDGEQVRGLYHEGGRDANTIYIHASKTRLIEIYSRLKAGERLDGRGNEKNGVK